MIILSFFKLKKMNKTTPNFTCNYCTVNNSKIVLLFISERQICAAVQNSNPWNRMLTKRPWQKICNCVNHGSLAVKSVLRAHRKFARHSLPSSLHFLIISTIFSFSYLNRHFIYSTVTIHESNKKVLLNTKFYFFRKYCIFNCTV